MKKISLLLACSFLLSSGASVYSEENKHEEKNEKVEYKQYKYFSFIANF